MADSLDLNTSGSLTDDIRWVQRVDSAAVWLAGLAIITFVFTMVAGLFLILRTQRVFAVRPYADPGITTEHTSLGLGVCVLVLGLLLALAIGTAAGLATVWARPRRAAVDRAIREAQDKLAEQGL